MAEIKWIKIVTDIFDNRKVKQIEALPDADSILVIWFKLICLAGSINDGGRIYFLENVPYTDEMLATQFRRPLNTVRMALDTFRQFGMIAHGLAAGGEHQRAFAHSLAVFPLADPFGKAVEGAGDHPLIILLDGGKGH